MIIKGQARGRSRQLAAHLLRGDQNEAIRLFECRGTVAQDVASALHEMEAQSAVVTCKRPLYHASISPEAQSPLTGGQVRIAVDLLEKKLGLTAQPRLIVLHRKDGREHVHVVWSRIDVDGARAISDSWSYRRHEEAARELEVLFGHKRLRSTHGRNQGQVRRTRTLKNYELQQSERSGLSSARVSAELRAVWRSAKNGAEFRTKLKEAGYTLARGDRRVFVVIDPAGEVHSLTRRLGEGSEDVRVRLHDVNLHDLPSVGDVRSATRVRQKQARLVSGFATVRREITARTSAARPTSIQSYQTESYAMASDQMPSADTSARYRSARAIVVSNFAARIAEALRFAPQEQIAAILIALKQERDAALAALTRDHTVGAGQRRLRRLSRKRQRRRPRYAVRWRLPLAGVLRGRSIRP